MKIKIGDQVRFLNDAGEGRVIRLLQNNLVEVRTPDGWDIPYPVHELVVMPSEEGGEAYKPEPFEDKKDNIQSVQKVSGTMELKKNTTEIFLLLVQEKENEHFSGIRCYLVNDSDQNLDFVYYRIGLEKSKIELRESLEPGTKIFLDELNLPALSSIKGWQIQGILSNPDQDYLSPVINQFIPFQTKKFASPGAYGENDFLQEPAMVILMVASESESLAQSVDSLDISKIVMQKESENDHLNTPRIFKPIKPDRPPREIDLHINQLIDRVIGLSNRDIINIQMETFHRELNLAISTNERTIVFIHGIGNGTLKKELRKSIEEDYAVCDYEDASFKEYGFGATMVRIRQNK